MQELETIKVLFYRVAGGQNLKCPFCSAIQSASEIAKEKRYKRFQRKGFRLEAIRRDSGIILMDFAVFKYAGPGHGSPDGELGTFEMPEGGYFVKRAAVLYSSERNYVLLESTSGGIAPNLVGKYFAIFSKPKVQYKLVPVFDSEAAAKVRSMNSIANAKFRVYIGSISEEDRNMDVGAIRALGENFGAGYVDITLGVERYSGGSLFVRKVRDLLGLAEPEIIAADKIDKLIVKGRPDSDTSNEIVDYLSERERKEVDAPIDDKFRAISRENRWDTLLKCYREYIADEG